MTTAADPSLLAAIPSGLRKELLDSYDKIVKNFRLEKWEPSELNGGKFCEVVYSILNGHVASKYPSRASKPPNMVRACQALESASGFPRSIRIQIPRMLIALYEVRNNRNVGHVGGDVDPNHMDAVCVLSISRWILAELIRVFHGVSTDVASAAVESLTDRELLSVWEIDGSIRVLDTSLRVREQILLVCYQQSKPIKVTSLISWLEYGNPSRMRNEILKKAHQAREIEFDRSADTVVISPKGSRWVEENLTLAK